MQTLPQSPAQVVALTMPAPAVTVIGGPDYPAYDYGYPYYCYGGPYDTDRTYHTGTVAVAGPGMIWNVPLTGSQMNGQLIKFNGEIPLLNELSPGVHTGCWNAAKHRVSGMAGFGSSSSFEPVRGMAG